MNYKEKEVLVFFCMFFLFSFISAQDLKITEEERSALCINNSYIIMEDLAKEGFSVIRVNDTIKEAKTLFEAQQILKSKNLETDYSKILKKCSEIETIKFAALSMRDKIKALERFYENYGKNINSSDIDYLFSQINREMKNERYEIIDDLIEKTYIKITEEQSKLSFTRTFYDSTTKNMKRFLREKWQPLFISILVFLILIHFFKTPIKLFFLKRKMLYLEMRKKSIKDLIAKNQNIYFNKGKISEVEFTIKNKKLSELVRDIDRQISLLKEQLEEINERKKKNANRDIKNKKR